MIHLTKALVWVPIPKSPRPGESLWQSMLTGRWSTSSFLVPHEVWLVFCILIWDVNQADLEIAGLESVWRLWRSVYLFRIRENFRRLMDERIFN